MEGVGSAVENSRSVAGKCNGHDGQHQSDEGDHSIHDVVYHGGNGPELRMGRLSLGLSLIHI